MKSFVAKNQHYTKPGRAINLDDGSYDSVLIDGCTFDNTGGIFIQAKAGMSIVIQNCTATNIIKTPQMEYAQFVQVSGCNSKNTLASIPISLQILNNSVTNHLGVCDVEDVINLIMVTGSKLHPLLVEGNKIMGASPKDISPKSLQNYSGGGIICDRGTSYALIQRNAVNETTNYGIGIAGGTNNAARVNHVNALHAINVGIYCHNQYPGDPFEGNYIAPSNQISWMTAKGRNDLWVE